MNPHAPGLLDDLAAGLTRLTVRAWQSLFPPPPEPARLTCGCDPVDNLRIPCRLDCGLVVCETHRDRLDNHHCPERWAI